MIILLVDDDPVIRIAARHALTSAGHTVLEAGSGAAALELAHDAHPDLLLLDVVLDGEDGTEVADRLRALPHLATIPLVFLTGRADAERDRLIERGAAGVLAKPFDITTLAGAVERLAGA